MRIFKMNVDLPFLPKGAIYHFDDETGFVYREMNDGQISEHPLRTGIANYLWLLTTEGKKYLHRIRRKVDDEKIS